MAPVDPNDELEEEATLTEQETLAILEGEN